MPRKFKIQIVKEIHIIIFNSSQSETRYWIIDPDGHSFKIRNIHKQESKRCEIDHDYLFQNILYLIAANQKLDIGSSILMATPSKPGILKATVQKEWVWSWTPLFQTLSYSQTRVQKVWAHLTFILALWDSMGTLPLIWFICINAIHASCSTSHHPVLQWYKTTTYSLGS